MLSPTFDEDFQLDSSFSFDLFPSDPSSEEPKLFSEEIIDDKKIFQCLLPHCGRSFRFRSEMDRHQATHSNIRPFPCMYEGCTKSFKRPDALKNHMRTHSKVPRYICSEEGCGYQFINRAALKYHFLKHKNNKVYKCSYPDCNRAFVSQTQLRQHEKTVKYHKQTAKNQSSDKDDLELLNFRDYSVDGNISLPDTGIPDYESQDDMKTSAKMSIKDHIRSYNMQLNTEEEDDDVDVFSYLESIYGRKRRHVEQNSGMMHQDYVVEGSVMQLFNSNLTENEMFQTLRSVEEENKELKRKLILNQEPVIPELDFGYCSNSVFRRQSSFENIDMFLNL